MIRGNTNADYRLSGNPAICTNKTEVGTASPLISFVKLGGHDQPLPVATIIQAAEGETGANVLAGRPKEQRAKAARARKNRGEPPVVKMATEEPAVVEKTFLDEATELNLETKDLRSQLSAKLLEQNAYLRRCSSATTTSEPYSIAKRIYMDHLRY